MPHHHKCNPSAHPTPSNAFRRRFLRRFDERDEPVTALEADMAGPWSVVPLPGEGFGLFRAGEHLSRGFGPTAVFPDRSLALLAAAILPGTGREPLLSLNGNPDPVSGRYSLRLDDGTIVGHVRTTRRLAHFAVRRSLPEVRAVVAGRPAVSTQ